MTGSLTVKNGMYYAILSYSDESGKRKQKWISSGLAERGNKRRAEDFLKQTLADFIPTVMTPKPEPSAAEASTPSEEMPFVDFMYRWLEHTRNSIELNTYESYKSVITRYIKPYFESSQTTLTALQPIQVQEMYNHYMAKGLSATTVLKIHANVRKALGHAVRMNMIPYNPAERVELPKKQKFVGSFYTEEQVNQLLAQTVNEPIYPAILLGAFYGLRRSEILGLRWRNVDLEAGMFTICNTVVQYNTLVEKPRTKNEASLRTLPLVPTVRDFLIRLKKQQMENKLFFGSEYVDNDFVVKRKDGQPFRPDFITEQFRRIMKNSSLPTIRFHDLRHTAATMLLAQGFSLKEIQEWLGHGGHKNAQLQNTRTLAAVSR